MLIPLKPMKGDDLNDAYAEERRRNNDLMMTPASITVGYEMAGYEGKSLNVNSKWVLTGATVARREVNLYVWLISRVFVSNI